MRILRTIRTKNPIRLRVSMRCLTLYTKRPTRPQPTFNSNSTRFSRNGTLTHLTKTYRRRLITLTRRPNSRNVNRQKRTLPIINRALNLKRLINLHFRPIPPLVPTKFSSIHFRRRLPFIATRSTKRPKGTEEITILLISNRTIFLTNKVRVVRAPTMLNVIQNVRLSSNISTLTTKMSRHNAKRFRLLSSNLLLTRLRIITLRRNVTMNDGVNVLTSNTIREIRTSPYACFEVAITRRLTRIATTNVRLNSRLPYNTNPTTFYETTTINNRGTFNRVNRVFVQLGRNLRMTFRLVREIPLFERNRLINFRPT